MNIQTATKSLEELKNQEQRLNYLSEISKTLTGETTSEQADTLMKLFTTDLIKLKALKLLETLLGDLDVAARSSDVRDSTPKLETMALAAHRIFYDENQANRLFSAVNEVNQWWWDKFTPTEEQLFQLLKLEKSPVTRRKLILAMEGGMSTDIPTRKLFATSVDTMTSQIRSAVTAASMANAKSKAFLDIAASCDTQIMEQSEIETLLQSVPWATSRAIVIVWQCEILDHLNDLGYVQTGRMPYLSSWCDDGKYFPLSVVPSKESTRAPDETKGDGASVIVDLRTGGDVVSVGTSCYSRNVVAGGNMLSVAISTGVSRETLEAFTKYFGGV